MKQGSIHDCNTFIKVLIIDTDVLFLQLFQKQVDNQHDTGRWTGTQITERQLPQYHLPLGDCLSG